MSIETARAARLSARKGQHSQYTSGMAPGFVQGNVVIVPQALAGDWVNGRASEWAGRMGLFFNTHSILSFSR